MSESGVSCLAVDEVLIGSGRLLGIKGEGILALCLKRGVESEHLPIACLYSLLHLFLAVSHTALDGVHLTRSVADDDGRSGICLSLCHSLESLVHISAHSNLCNVNVAVGHSDLCKVLLADCLTCCCELSNLTDVGSLGSLSAGVGVNLGIEYHYVYILAGSENVVKTAEADIVCPTVSAEDPNCLLGKEGLLCEDLSSERILAIASLEHSNESLSSSLVSLTVVYSVEIVVDDSCLSLVGAACAELLNVADELLTNSLLTNVHTETVLCVILEEGVSPSGTSACLLVYCVRSSGCGAAPDRRTTGSVGYIHSLTEELGDKTSVRGLCTTRARAGVLEEGLLELAALDSGSNELGLFGNLSNRVVVSCLLVELSSDGLHLDSCAELLVLVNGTSLNAESTSHTVEGRYCHCKLVVSLKNGLSRKLGNLGSACCLFLCHSEGTDTSVRTYECTVVTLDTVLGIPLRNGNSNASLLVSRRALREGTVRIGGESTNGERVTLHCANGNNDVVNEVNERCASTGNLSRGSVNTCVLPGLGNCYKVDSILTCVDSSVVEVNDSLTLLEIGLGSHILHIAVSLINGKDVSKGEECRLKNSVLNLCVTKAYSELCCVDCIELDTVVSDVGLNRCGKVSVELCICPLAVKKEGTAGLNVGNHIVLRKVCRVVASYKVSLIDIVRGLDGAVTESEVRNGDTAGLLGVILEVCLNELVGMVADDLDGVLVSTNGTVTAETPELALNHISGSCVGSGLLLEGVTGKIVNYADSEVILLFACHVLINCEDGSGSSILRAETVSTAENLNAASANLVESCDNVEVKGLAKRAGLLGSVKYGNDLCTCGNSLSKLCRNEGSVKSYLNETNLLALCKKIIYNLLCYVTYRAHSDDNALCVGCTVVVEELVVSAELCVNLAHVLLYNCGKSVIVGVARLSVLEEDIAVLCRAAKYGVLGVERSVAERLNCVHINHFLKILVIPSGNLLNLVRGSEAVEEVEEGYSGLDGSEVSYCTEVHDFLCVGLCEHSKAGLTASIYVGVITEDVKSVGSNTSCGYVNNARKKLTGDLVHVGDHKKKTLRCGVGCGKSTCSERTVNCTCSARLRLHLNNLNILTENVLCRLAEDVLVGSRPCVCYLSHRAGRCDGVDSSNLCERVRYVSSSGVTIHRNFLSFYHWLVLHIKKL